ncbi:MAG: hypothetical protein AAFY05_15185, partial [Pseudomonadota bacterium]
QTWLDSRSAFVFASLAWNDGGWGGDGRRYTPPPSFRASAVPDARRSGIQTYVALKARLLTVVVIVFASLTNVSGFHIGIRLRLTGLE